MHRLDLIQKKGMHEFFYWACAAIVWTYMSVTIIGAYRSWYITTAGVLALALLFFLAGVLQAGGLWKSTFPVLLYYLCLAATGIWAEYRDTTLWFVASESIFIFVFILFYLLSINLDIKRTVDFFPNLILPALIIFLISYMIDPEAIRLGGYASAFLPFLLLFSAHRLVWSASVWNILLVSLCLAMLVLGMSRTPLLVAGIGIILILIMITKGWKARRKLAVVFASVSVVLALAILLFQPLRLYATKTLVRISYQDFALGEQIVEAEEPDIIRWTIFEDAFALLKENWLFGMGYMNFMPWFRDEYDFEYTDLDGNEIAGMNLHNSFQTWTLEGGLPCVFAVVLMLWKYFAVLKRQIKRSENDMERSCCRMYVIAMICLLVMGVFHQIHQTPFFYILLGIVYAFDRKEQLSDVQAPATGT